MTTPLNDAWVTRCNEQLKKLTSSLQGPSEQLNESMRYVLMSGGKRLRACLVYAIGEHFNLKLTHLDPIASAIECVHAFSLVHDDLPAMDDDDWRRHQPSCHKAFDEATAILCGDALLSESFALITQTPSPAEAIVRMIQEMSRAIGAHGLCGGQSMDMQLSADTANDENLLQIQEYKTGALFSAACTLPYLASNQHDASKLHHLKQLGIAIGHCLQISDDILDLLATQNDIGKTPNKDAEQNKASYGNMHTLSTCLERCESWKQKALHHLNVLDIRAALIPSLLDYLTKRAQKTNC